MEIVTKKKEELEEKLHVLKISCVQFYLQRLDP